MVPWWTTVIFYDDPTAKAGEYAVWNNARVIETSLHKLSTTHNIKQSYCFIPKMTKATYAMVFLLESKDIKINSKSVIIFVSSKEYCMIMCRLLKNFQLKVLTYNHKYPCKDMTPIHLGIIYKKSMSVGELFNIFTDKLDKQLQYDSHYNITQYLFDGVFETQMIGGKCKHYKEKSDPFATLTLDVKGKQDIKNRSNPYVQGDAISDYQFDKCNKRIEILNRSHIQILPRKLVTHLKRFDFDIETFVNSSINI